MQFYFGNIRIRAYVSYNKKFTNHCGRKWVYSSIDIDGEKIKCWHDFKFGTKIYFDFKGICRAMPMQSTFGDKQKYSFNPVVEEVKLTTQLSHTLILPGLPKTHQERENYIEVRTKYLKEKGLPIIRENFYGS